MVKNRQNWGVIFDMDGVLVDSAPAHFESWQILAREERITIKREQFDGAIGRKSKDIIPLFFGPVSPDRLLDIDQRKEAIYRDLVRARVPAVEGAANLVAALAADGIPLAIGSAGPRPNIEMVLQAMGVARCFEAIVSGEDAARGKPDPQVFQLACGRLRLPPARCVVIEDATAGVAAARAAGTRVAAVMMHYDEPTLTEAGADLVVPRLRDLTVTRLKALVADT